MKSAIHALLLMLVVLAPVRVFAADRWVRLSVPDMNCPACPVTVRKSLERVTGVEVQSVDLKSKTAVVLIRDDRVTDAALTQATAGGGYPSVVVPENIYESDRH
ncbi:MAG: cation transporter [Nevskiales bacterium]